jgi:hypothetical protein
MQKDLDVEVSVKEREGLVRLGLLDVTTMKGGAKKITVTDAGWAWANDFLDAPLPTKASARITLVLQQWLKLFKAYMYAEKVSLADVFTRSRPFVLVEKSPYGVEEPTKHTTATVFRRVREGYLFLTGGRIKTRCLLRDLRANLPDIDRAQLDAALQQMAASGEAVLFRLDNRLDITPADDEAGIFMGGEKRHILWIDR